MRSTEHPEQSLQHQQPPSLHPVTGKPYEVEKPLNILRVSDLDDVATWIEKFKTPQQEWQPPRGLLTVNSAINPGVIGAIATGGHSCSGGLHVKIAAPNALTSFCRSN